MRNFRIRLGLTLFALAALVGVIASLIEAVLNAVILYAIAAFLAWQGVMAFLGRIKPEKASGGTDQPEVMKATGEVVKGTGLFLRRVVTVLLLFVLVPMALLLVAGGINLLYHDMVLAAGAAFLAAGGIAWCCWGRPLRALWGPDGGEEPPVTHPEPNRAIPGPPSVRLSLPEEIILLSYRYGVAWDDERAAIACAGAEIGELALRRRVEVVGRKYKVLGADIRVWSGAIRVLDSTPTGLAWADELLAELVRRASSRRRSILPGASRTGSGNGTVGLEGWLRERGDKALLLHRDLMAERGLLFHRPGFRPGQEERHYSDPAVREELVRWLRAVDDGRVPLLLNLLTRTGLGDELGLTSRTSRAHRDDESLAEEVREMNAMLAVSMAWPREGDGGGE